jgi:hypothetical protein
MAEKESVTNIYKQLKRLHGVDAFDKSTVGCWALQIASSEKGQVVLSNMCRCVQPTTLVTQALLQQADELI